MMRILSKQEMTMSALLAPSVLSVKEYLSGERLADCRHEYIAGDVYAMAGASKRHNYISLNIAVILRGAARGGHCGVFISDMKLRIETKKSIDSYFYYPDVMVVCDTDDDQSHYETSPCLIVEVLSPSTKLIDQREKCIVYKNISSLKYYILVSSTKAHIEYYQRNDQGLWDKSGLGQDEVIKVHCGDYHADLSFQAIYEDVVWSV